MEIPFLERFPVVSVLNVRPWVRHSRMSVVEAKKREQRRLKVQVGLTMLQFTSDCVVIHL